MITRIFKYVSSSLLSSLIQSMLYVSFFLLYYNSKSIILYCRYGPVWITTTLVFILAAFGNFATYLMHQRNEQDIVWNFDVTYVNWAASIIYGYALGVPPAFYFLFQYFGASTSLIRLWCLWGYSLFIFIPTSVSINFFDCPFYNYTLYKY